jgi:uncharacterized protein YecE (DUF72 family)
MTALVGCSGWSYPSGAGTWNGIFYPSPRPRGFDELAYYAEHFDSVEVNSTFYRVPEPALCEAWLRRTPVTFEFAVKLYQKFTHPEMYVKRPGVAEWDVTEGDLDQFRTGLEPLAASGRLAALLIQFPSSFHREPDTAAYVEWLLAKFRAYPLAVELRHRSWSDRRDETRSLLETQRAAWVHIDEPKFAGSIEQDLAGTPHDDAAVGETTSLAYFRLHGRNGAEWWTHEHRDDRYNYLYSAAELAPFAMEARAATARGRKVLMYLNNHFSAKAVANAAVLRHQLGDLVPGEYSRAMVDRYPELAGIVRTSGLPI